MNPASAPRPPCIRCSAPRDGAIFCPTCGLCQKDKTSRYDWVTFTRRLFGNWLLEVTLMVLTFLIGWLIWFCFTQGKGQTPAKAVVGTMVVDERTGKPVTGVKLLGREVGVKIVCVLLAQFALQQLGQNLGLPERVLATLSVLNIVWLLNVGWVLVDRDRRALHDLLLGTVVVKRERPARLAWDPPFALPSGGEEAPTDWRPEHVPG